MTNRLTWQRALLLLLILVAVVLRLRVYLAHRSLWLDEALLTLNLLERSFAGLLQPLDYGQAAPVGLLLAQRLMIDLFGSSEYVLRGIPVFASICSVVLFAWLATKMLSPMAAILAVGMFAISDPLLHFAVQVKQYSSDVAVALGMWSLCAFEKDRLDRDDPAAWSLVAGAGVVATWLSHPAIFVAGGIAVPWLWQALRRRPWTSFFIRSVAAALWLASFAALYFLSLRFVSQSLHVSWRGAAMPVAPLSGRDMSQYYNFVWTLGVLPLGQQVGPLVVLAGLIGVFALWRRRSRPAAWCAGALFFACLASMVGKYPVTVRLWLFLVPAIVIVVAAGVDELWDRTRHVFPALAPLLAGLILLYPVVTAARVALEPPGQEEIRPLLQHIEAHRRDGDVLYVYRETQYALRYYTARGFQFRGEVLTGPMDDPYSAERDVDGLRGRARVWFLFSHVLRTRRPDEEALLLYFLNRVGVQVEAVRRPGATLYLYDLSRTR